MGGHLHFWRHLANKGLVGILFVSSLGSMHLKNIFFLALIYTAQAQPVKLEKDASREIHMLVPGFTVSELPLKLTNLVNLQYRHDGVLVALGYNGNIHLLRDTDGDGLEDKADLFWQGKGKVSAPIGMDLAPKGTPHGDAVFFACKGKVMMVTDRDGDGKAEEEKVLAEGWPLALAGIDTASVCYDPKDGAVFFGLGVKVYNNAYEFDALGKPQNDLSSERGAILSIAPDFKSREKLCTGVRWPIGLRFNEKGDLFCTDQEGATWLPNGNPFDELLHIERGRHYGFPPRHPKHLPKVIDEPSVADYGPQHQSTCGFSFNQGVNGGLHFGPDWWKGDALVTGESRGKIYRTKLVKTPAGYVAQTQIIACLNQLTVDLTVTPRGDLLVVTHSGKPDWGSGPEGKGRIFRIRYTDKEAAQPMMAYFSAEDRLEVKFDKPFKIEVGRAVLSPPRTSPETLQQPAPAAQQAPNGLSVQRGLFTRAGDRFEQMWPGYEVIKLQRSMPVPHLVAKPLEGGALEIAPQKAVENYSIQLADDLEVEATLQGVAVWSGESDAGWMPHLDAQVSHELLGGHMPSLHKGHPTTLLTRLDLYGMLQPAIQPGAALDYEPEAEEVTLWISSTNTPFTAEIAGKKHSSQLGQITHDLIYTHIPERGRPLDLRLSFKADTMPDFRISYRTKQDPTRDRALALRRFLLPWARPEETPGIAVAIARPEIQGSDWKHGSELFFSDKALCSKCHAVRGNGGKIGPDLSNLTSRNYASVKRDIHDPHVALNPEYLTQEVTLKDGRQFSAVMREDAGQIVLGIGAGVELRVKPEEIASQKALKTSLMMPKLDEVLGESDFRDLMAYLLTEPPVMRVYNEHAPVVKRSRAEIDAALAGAVPLGELKPMKLLLVSGKKDHGIGEHDYPRWRQAWARLFSLADQVSVDLADEWPSDEQWQSADAVVFNRRGNWDDAKAKQFDAFLARGGGVTLIHWSLAGGEKQPTASLAQRLGLASQQGLTKYRHGMVELTLNSGHPITRGFDHVSFNDEMYWNLVGTPPASVLATAAEAGAQYPHAWTQEPKSGGRIFVTLGGHYSSVFDDPLFRILLLRGIAWTANQPVDRYNKLIEAGLEP
jgi:putative heme-binding domain-containing protein